MYMSVLEKCQSIVLLICVAKGAEGCVDSKGTFYCATLWYFWFGIFWFFIFLFVGLVCFVNHWQKRKNRIAATTTPRIRSPVRRTMNSAKSRKSIVRTASRTSNTHIAYTQASGTVAATDQNAATGSHPSGPDPSLQESGVQVSVQAPVNASAS